MYVVRWMYEKNMSATSRISRFCSFLVTAGISCATVSNDIGVKGLERPEMLRRLVLAIPVGTTISDAEKILRKKGFVDIHMMHEPFMESDSNGLSQIHDAAQYLYANREDSISFMMSVRWQVALACRENTISEVWLSRGLVGP